MRHFTLEEATAALQHVQPLTEEMVEAYRRLRTLQGQLQERLRVAQGNGRHSTASNADRLQADAESASVALTTCVDRLTEIGVQVKDMERGLVDFPARRGDETVLLCWLLGEGRIGYWHGVEEGYAGRKPLPL
jgi:hypothetical protein